ncbi:MAG: LuxR C-terminal-related transcriptional regulator [Bradymonadaceae bacterium]
MLRSQSSVVEQLQGVDATSAEEVRQTAVGALADRVGCDAVLFYSYALHEGRCYHTAVTSTGDSEIVELTREIEGKPSTVSPRIWDPFAPEPDQKNRFVSMQFEPERLVDQSDSWLLRTVYGEGHIPCQTRALLYDRRQFLGWVGLMRRRREPFEARETDELDELVPSLTSALSAADQLEDETLAEPADIIFEPAGPSVEYASEGAEEWLSAERIESLAELVGRVERRRQLPSTVIRDGYRLRIARLEGALGVRYSVTVGPADRPTLNPKAMLTPRQREVAEFAAVGATADEIAETLQISPNTVRDHIRRIYRRLGIGCRAELARKIGGSG